MNGYDMNGWGWAGMVVMAVVLIALAAVVVWALTRRSTGSQVSVPSAREILDARLASGEIDVEEFEKRLDVLERH